jgi:ADP-ribose pyrophosphatase
MDESYSLEQLTQCPWVNLFRIQYNHKSRTPRAWMMCSRKPRPIEEASQPDAVVIVPTIDTASGRKLVVTKEFRVPLWDYEYGFPAGLIDEGESVEVTVARELKEETGLDLVKINHISMPVYSSAGLTDESCVMAMVEASGEVSNIHQEQTEDIETVLMDAHQIGELLASRKKVAAKAWGLLYHYHQLGRIE